MVETFKQIQSLVLNIQEKQEELNDLYSLITPEEDALIKSRAFRYVIASNVYGSNDGPRFGGSIDNYSICGNVLTANWSERWAYGGYEEGYFNVPLQFILDENKLIEFEKQKELEKLQEEEGY